MTTVTRRLSGIATSCLARWPAHVLDVLNGVAVGASYALSVSRVAAGDALSPSGSESRDALSNWAVRGRPLSLTDPSSCCEDGAMPGEDRRATGRLFDEVAELYDRVRPTYPDELFADLVAITGIHEGSSVLEVGCGTGQATRSLAALGFSVTAVEPGAGMAALARQRLSELRQRRGGDLDLRGVGRPGSALRASPCRRVVALGGPLSGLATGPWGPSVGRMDGPDRQRRGPPAGRG